MARPSSSLRQGTPSAPLKCAILVSGSGSGMVALAEAQQARADAPYTVSLVISNNPSAPAIGKAKRLGLPTQVIDHCAHPADGRRQAHETVVLKTLKDYNIELVVLSGYMRLLSPRFLELWEAPVLNIHPSLLPAFPGAHAHRDVLAAGVTMTGCTVHLVDEGTDTGLVLDQRPVPVLKGDDENALSERVKFEEHRLYPQVIENIARGVIVLSHDGRSIVQDPQGC